MSVQTLADDLEVILIGVSAATFSDLMKRKVEGFKCPKFFNEPKRQG